MRFVFLLVFLYIMTTATAWAQCTGPAGVAEDIIYNTTYNVPQYCNGTDWIAFGALNPAAGGSGCTGPTGVAGDLLYNNAYHVLQYCDGDDWQAVGSGIETPTSLPGPAGCENIGDQCADTTIFAGWHPITHEKLFIPPADQGTTSAWKTSTGSNDIATDSFIDGRINTNQVANSATFPAFKLCKDLSTGGYTDWYLPSREELSYLYNNRTQLESGPMTDFDWSGYWSSREFTNNLSWYVHFSDGGVYTSTKTDTYRVRCMRR